MLGRKSKTGREKYRDWRREKRLRRAERFKSLRDKIYLARFLGYLGHYKKQIALIGVLIVVNSLIGLVLPFTARFVLDYTVPRRDFALLNGIILAGVGVYLAYALFRYLEQRLAVTFSMDLITEIRRDLFNYQLNLPLSYFEKSSPGKLISKLTYSIMMIKILVETFAYVCFRELTMIAVIMIAAAIIDWRLTLIFLALTPLVVLYVKRLNRYMKEVAVKLQTKNDQIIRVLDRAYHSVKLFQVFGGGLREGDHFEKILNEDKKFRIERTMVYVTNSIVITLLASLVILAALWYGGRQIIAGQMKYGDVLAYMICLGMLFRPLSEFVRASAFLQAGLIGIRTIFSVFENTSPIEEPTRPIRPARREGRIQFKNVWFSHGKGRGGLRGIKFTAEPGKKILVVGRSGAGKSTLFNLLLRLYEPERGEILIDGVNIRRMRLTELRDYFSVVVQDQLHVEDTVLNNIFLGSIEETGIEKETQLEKALEMGRHMGMNRFIASLQNRFNHKIDASGMGFSRGELQKLAIMRAAAKPAPIILMDEPTASLDHHHEREVIKIMDEQFKGKTTLIISHRPLPQYHPDWILVLRKGFIEAQGNHNDLLEHCKFYRQLLKGPRSPLGEVA